MKHLDVAIAGGGLIGSAIALMLYPHTATAVLSAKDGAQPSLSAKDGDQPPDRG